MRVDEMRYRNTINSKLYKFLIKQKGDLFKLAQTHQNKKVGEDIEWTKDVKTIDELKTNWEGFGKSQTDALTNLKTEISTMQNDNASKVSEAAKKWAEIKVAGAYKKFEDLNKAITAASGITYEMKEQFMRIKD